MDQGGKSSWAAALGVVVMLGAAGYAALFLAPAERSMGLIQRIFYLHVPSAWTGFVAFFIVFAASIAYLLRREARWDWLAVSAAEVGVAFFTVVLVTGPIWARPVWGIWWTWDARLTSAFVLWVLYVSYLILRTLVSDSERRAVVAAVFGIFAFLDVPLVYFSIWLWRTQHPQPVIGRGGFLEPRMKAVLFACWAALLALMALLMRERYRLEALRHDVQDLSIVAELRDVDRSASPGRAAAQPGREAQ